MTTRATRSPRRRTVVALLVVLIVLVAFIVRLVDIQVVNAEEHESDARSLAMEVGSPLYGTRGDITDVNGATLATTSSVYDAKIDPKLAVQGIKRKDDAGATISVSWPELAVEIAAVTGQDAAEVEGIVTTAVAADPESRFAYLERGLST